MPEQISGELRAHRSFATAPELATALADWQACADDAELEVGNVHLTRLRWWFEHAAVGQEP